MLFTVTESRDARLVAESADRSVKVVFEGASFGMVAGDSFTVCPKIEARIIAAASGPVAPESLGWFAHELVGGPNDPEMSDQEREALESVVTTDPSTDPLAESPEEA